MYMFSGPEKRSLIFKGSGERAIYVVQQEYISTVEKNFKKTKEDERKSDAHRVTSTIDWLSSEINERSKTNKLSLNSDGIEVKLVWTMKYCRTQEDREHISESIISTMRSLEIEEEGD